MSTPYTLFVDIAAAAEMPSDGTLSRTLHNDERAKIVLFSFSPGQELSEHTSSSPAVMHFLSGEAEVTLGPDAATAVAGTWIHMPAQLPHSIRTKTPVVMLLTLMKATA
ncbi:MAG: cupin domain-containing protein [Planctomycetales bacterium]|nr:cupin domain-containing protein [Planctomycetales bacterium]MCA9257710.1 cupin domain-containing protein [Planctomycetales bacterium]